MSIASHTGVSQVFHGCFAGVSRVFHGCFASVFTGVFTGVSRVFIWAQEPFTETIHRDHSPKPFTQTIHRDHSRKPFTESLDQTKTFHPKPFTQNLSQKPLHKLTITPLISQYPTHFPFSILSRILTQYPHYNPSLNLGSDPFIQTSG